MEILSPRYVQLWEGIAEAIALRGVLVKESFVGYDPKSEQVPHTVPKVSVKMQPTKGHVMVDVTAIATEAEKVVESVARVEPTLATMAGMFVPGAAPVVATVQPWVLLAIPYIERALNDIAANNGGDLMNATIELLQHNSKGHPNSESLKP